MAIEQCLSINSRQRGRISRLPGKISTVYIGSDACEHLMPLGSDAEKILSLSKNPVMQFPVLTDYFLEKAYNEVQYAANINEGIEISVNDIGTLAYFHKAFGGKIKLSTGRILTYLWSKSSIDFVKEIAGQFGISCFETDEANTANSMSGAGLRTALHYPYRFYGITRTCYYTKETLHECSRRCPDSYIPLGDGKVLWRGNAYYTKPSEMPKNPPARIILSYDLP